MNRYETDFARPAESSGSDLDLTDVGLEYIREFVIKNRAAIEQQMRWYAFANSRDPDYFASMAFDQALGALE